MRVAGLGELSASIAHEVNQPLGAIMFNAEACISWLDCDPPNMNEAHAALQRIFRDGTRAAEVIRRIRALSKNTDTKMVPLNLDEVLGEALSFVHHELSSSRVAVRMEPGSVLPVVLADKVQLQQVILNLVMNGIDAMQPIMDRPRELVIRSEQDDEQYVRVTVTDCGVGFPRPARIGCSIHSSRPSPEAWAWGYRSAAPSSNCTAGASGLCRIGLTVRASSSHCLCIQKRSLVKCGGRVTARTSASLAEKAG